MDYSEMLPGAVVRANKQLGGRGEGHLFLIPAGEVGTVLPNRDPNDIYSQGVYCLVLMHTHHDDLNDWRNAVAVFLDGCGGVGRNDFDLVSMSTPNTYEAAMEKIEELNESE